MSISIISKEIQCFWSIAWDFSHQDSIFFLMMLQNFWWREKNWILMTASDCQFFCFDAFFRITVERNFLFNFSPMRTSRTFWLRFVPRDGIRQEPIDLWQSDEDQKLRLVLALIRTGLSQMKPLELKPGHLDRGAKLGCIKWPVMEL